MHRRIHNWKAKDVITFLESHNFTLHRTKGSHKRYVKKSDEGNYYVTVPYHAHRSINPKTLKAIITQSGIDQSKWHD